MGEQQQQQQEECSANLAAAHADMAAADAAHSAKSSEEAPAKEGAKSALQRTLRFSEAPELVSWEESPQAAERRRGLPAAPGGGVGDPVHRRGLAAACAGEQARCRGLAAAGGGRAGEPADSQAPTRQEDAPAAVVDAVDDVPPAKSRGRWNLEYEIQGCCGPSDGLAAELLEQVPEVLAKRGLKADVWTKYTRRLRSINRLASGAGDVPSAVCIALLSPAILLTGCCCGYLFRYEARKLVKWDEAFRAWQAEFNEELEPLGIFVKSQSVCFANHGMQGEKERQVHRWLAIAFTPSQVAKLKGEPHLRGDIESSGGCIAIDERELCMHPGC